MQAYEDAVRVLELHGLGTSTYDKEKDVSGFMKRKLYELSAAAREFLASLRVPSWFFALDGNAACLADSARPGNPPGNPPDSKGGDKDGQEDKEDGKDSKDDKDGKDDKKDGKENKKDGGDRKGVKKSDQESKKTRQQRQYAEILFNGSPEFSIGDIKALNAQVRAILAKTLHGQRDVRLKMLDRAKCIAVEGECSKKSCSSCEWRLLASLSLKPDGTSWLTVKCDGEHGEKSRPKGQKMWAPAEAAAIKTAHPNGALLSSRSVRAALADAGLDAHMAKLRLKQYVTRENRKRRGGKQCGQKPIVQELLESVKAWSDKQTTTFSTGPLDELRVVGAPDCGVGHAFFGWTCRGFLNHAVNPNKEPVCIVVDGKHKITNTGAVIATVSFLGKGDLGNTSFVHRSGQRVQVPLHTGTTRPILQAYMDAESTPNWIRLFELLCSVVKTECDYDLKPLVVQVQCDFNDAIEAARRKVFPNSRIARDYPHMMRAVHSTLTAKTHAELRGRIVSFIRATRFLPTLEIFSACWRAFLEELRDTAAKPARDYLVKEYLHVQQTENIKKFYGLREKRLVDCTDIFWADYWSGSLGMHPGSGTGSQTLEGFHSFWQSLLSRRTRQNPCNVLDMMQTLFREHWRSYMREDDKSGSSLWPKSPEPSFLNGTTPHRQGMSSAAEYWAHRHGNNHRFLERDNSAFWVMRSQASDTSASASAQVQRATAQHLVDLLHMSEAEVREALLNAKIVQMREGAPHVSISELSLLFDAHCVVMEGELPGRYCPKIHNRCTSKGRRLCTCSLFVQRAECPHVYFVAGLKEELDLNNMPEKRKPGRPRADAAKKKARYARK